MDAAGSGKPEASKFFEDLAYSPSNLKIQGGELVYQGKQAFPTRADAKANYKKIVTADGKSWTDTDSKIFDMGWQESVGIRNRMFIAELKTLIKPLNITSHTWNLFHWTFLSLSNHSHS